MNQLNPTKADLAKLAFSSFPGFLAFGFGSGLAPIAPGTFGTLAALPFLPLLYAIPLLWQMIWVAVALLAGIWICGVASTKLGVHDHGGIVWDEIAALWLCALFIPPQWPWIVAMFILFRFFDIIKPWPIGWADKQVSGGLGIMLDDILAAGWTIIILKISAYFIAGPSIS